MKDIEDPFGLTHLPCSTRVARGNARTIQILSNSAKDTMTALDIASVDFHPMTVGASFGYSGS
jgi:hypothetical protein